MFWAKHFSGLSNDTVLTLARVCSSSLSSMAMTDSVSIQSRFYWWCGPRLLRKLGGRLVGFCKTVGKVNPSHSELWALHIGLLIWD
ncbi:hypothetical protein V6N13_087597 [Hibiscus sabdariffa]|uniref:Secreted protein n=1 Tax=Hibiscus sabdariffa TaxID=183260 RepID=A0ABR2FWU5_9ROSI